MIELTPEEARTIVKSYAYLMELGGEYDFDLRPEEFRIYSKLDDATRGEEVTSRDVVAPAPDGVGAGPQDHIRNLPVPPADPHIEEDSYAPNVIE